VHEGTVKYLREIGQGPEKTNTWNTAAIEKDDRWIRRA